VRQGSKHLPAGLEQLLRLRLPAQSVSGRVPLDAAANGDTHQPPKSAQIPPSEWDEPLPIFTRMGTSSPLTKCLQESRMREICTSGSTSGSNGTGESRPLLSTLPMQRRKRHVCRRFLLEALLISPCRCVWWCEGAALTLQILDFRSNREMVFQCS
jgi:hypothetical protein